MSDATDMERITQLENKAKEIFLENCDWVAIIRMLEKDEQEEYYRLRQLHYGG